MDKVQHFEIPADDMARAKKFYGEVFGWKLSDVPGMDYTMVHTGKVDEQNMLTEPGVINGGMMQRGSVATAPVIVVTVDDVRAKIDAIKAAGGEALTDVTTVGDMGLYAYVKDTEGNVIGVFQALRS